MIPNSETEKHKKNQKPCEVSQIDAAHERLASKERKIKQICGEFQQFDLSQKGIGRDAESELKQADREKSRRAANSEGSIRIFTPGSSRKTIAAQPINNKPAPISRSDSDQTSTAPNASTAKANKKQ